MSKKILVLSLIFSLFILTYINAYNNVGSSFNIKESGFDAIKIVGNTEIVSFAVGNLMIYLVVTGVIYLFLRSVVKSFEGGKR